MKHITKKSENEIWIWDPNAFGGKGYWFVLGIKGGYGRAASKSEAQKLGKPKATDIEPVAPEVYEEKNTGEESQTTKTNKKMGYKKASQLRKRGLLELIAERKFEEGQSLGKAIKSSIGDKFKAKAKGFKEKFDPLNMIKALTGEGAIGKSIRTIAGRAMGRSEEDIEYFGGYARNKKKKSAVSVEKKSSGGKKVGQLANALYTNQSDGQNSKMKKGDGIADVLGRLYNIFKSNQQEDTKQSELKRSFEKKKSEDKEKWHKEILDALGGGKGKAVKVNKDGKPKEEPNMLDGFLNSIMELFEKFKLMLAPLLTFLSAMGSLALSSLTSLAGFLISPLGLGLLAAVAVGAIGKWMWEQIKLNPEAALRGEGGVGMAVAGLGSEGQLPSVENEQADKKQRKSYEMVKKSGPENASLEDLKAAKIELEQIGRLGAVNRVKKGSKDPKDVAEAKEYNDIVSAIQSKSATQVPAQEQSQNQSSPAAGAQSSGQNQSSPAAASEAKVESAPTQTASPMPAESSPVAQRVQSAIQENNDMKAEESGSSKVISVDNSQVINAGGGGGGSSVVVDSSVPVRIDDPTLQKISKQNLRPV